MMIIIPVQSSSLTAQRHLRLGLALAAGARSNAEDVSSSSDTVTNPDSAPKCRSWTERQGRCNTVTSDQPQDLCLCLCEDPGAVHILRRHF